MKWIVISQTIAVVTAGVILPFYIVYLHQAADSYSLFAYLYGSFTLAAALTHFSIGSISKRLNSTHLLVIGNITAGIVLIFVPSLTALWQLYIVQIILGVSMSLQKSAEKIAIADVTKKSSRAHKIGSYHGIVALSTAAALFISGWFLDTFSLLFLFYAAGIGLILAGILSLRVKAV
jgi:MFS family permease